MHSSLPRWKWLSNSEGQSHAMLSEVWLSVSSYWCCNYLNGHSWCFSSCAYCYFFKSNQDIGCLRWQASQFGSEACLNHLGQRFFYSSISKSDLWANSSWWTFDDSRLSYSARQRAYPRMLALKDDGKLSSFDAIWWCMSSHWMSIGRIFLDWFGRTWWRNGWNDHLSPYPLLPLSSSLSGYVCRDQNH